MKTLIALTALCLLLTTLSATTHIVSPDNFTTIQSAIVAGANGDSIIVYPGTYYENVDFLQKSLFLGSLYSTTQDTTYISQTIIDGMRQGPAVEVTFCDNATVEGFTITNGFFRYEYTWIVHPIFMVMLPPGGGVFVNISTGVNINNNIITNNVSLVGGGVCIQSASVSLKGNRIFRNMASYNAGGLYIATVGNDVTTLDNESKNSIYLNAAAEYNDIYIETGSLGLPFQPEIHLALATYSQTSSHLHRLPSETTLIIEEGCIEETDGNIYVSPQGDDNNSGFSPAEPLRTITMAVLKTQASLWPINTIYVADGVYSLETGELFPIQLKTIMNIEGESKENTIIDAGNLFTTVMGSTGRHPALPSPAHDITLKNFTILHDIIAGMNGHPFVLDFLNAYHPRYLLENISLNTETMRANSFGGIRIDNVNGQVELRNIEIYRTDDDNLDVEFPNLYDNDKSRWAISLQYTSLFMEHILVDGGNHGIRLDGPLHWSEKEPHIQEVSVMSNVLVKNLFDNTAEHASKYNSLYLVRASLTSEPYLWRRENFLMVNCTFFNNHGVEGVIYAGGFRVFDMYNNIIHNCEPDIIRLSCVSQYPASSIISHNLFDNMESSFVFDTPNYWAITYDNNINGDPLFTDEEPFPQALSEESPAINAGTTDILFYEFPLVDMAGNMRLGNMGDWLIDIGAYEYQWPISDSDEVVKPVFTTLIGNYPNPFNPETTIGFSLAKGGNVCVDVYNIKGQRVRSLVNDFLAAGVHRVVWNGVDDNGKSVGSGVYFYQLRAGDVVSTKKMLLMK